MYTVYIYIYIYVQYLFIHTIYIYIYCKEIQCFHMVCQKLWNTAPGAPSATSTWPPGRAKKLCAWLVSCSGGASDVQHIHGISMEYVGNMDNLWIIYGYSMDIYFHMIYIRIFHNDDGEIHRRSLIFSGWWYTYIPLRKILVNWDDYSQYG